MAGINAYDFALLALDSGIQIIPLNENKRPLVSFGNVEITPIFIETYKTYYDNATMIAVLCRGVWCIDIDVNHGDEANGFASLESIPFYGELDKNANETMIQQTASGGMHIIFKKREGIDYSQKINYLPGVDIKANDNNYFVYAGSVTTKGVYTRNELPPKLYEGDFEKRIFSKRGNYYKQMEDKETQKVNEILKDYDFSHLPQLNGQGGRGKQAYQRIIDGVWESRNNDLFMAVSYAKVKNISIEPLKVLIGTVKGSDEFTEEEFYKTVQSAFDNNE